MPSSDTSPPVPALHPTHYDLLGVARTATDVELRRAFRHLSKRYHPDTTSLPQAQAEEAFRRLKLAYGVLSDPGERRRYDALLFQPPSPLSPRSQAPGVGGGPAPDPVTLPGRPVSVRRALSGGEWFALLLLGVALALSLVLGLGVAWARGMDLVRSPSWWTEADAAAPSTTPQAPSAAASPQPLAADAPPAA